MQLTTIKHDTHDICILICYRSAVQRRVWLEKYLCWVLSVNKENVITFWICLVILPHSDISVFHTFYFRFLFWGKGCRYCEILIANPYWIFFFWQERRASFHVMYLTWHHKDFNLKKKQRPYHVYWITNNFQVRSKSKDWKTKWFKVLGAINSKGLNRIATIGLDHLCLRWGNLSFNNNYII